jgi:hypothetical protein
MSLRFLTGVLTTGVLAMALLTAGAQSSTRPAAHAAKACSVPDYPGSGYFTSLKVKHVSCRTGRRLALAYYRCRTKDGPAGRCHHTRVMRFRCHEIRQSISTEVDGRVTCKRGGKRVIHSYQQNL